MWGSGEPGQMTRETAEVAAQGSGPVDGPCPDQLS